MLTITGLAITELHHNSVLDISNSLHDCIFLNARELRISLNVLQDISNRNEKSLIRAEGNSSST